MESTAPELEVPEVSPNSDETAGQVESVTWRPFSASTDGILDFRSLTTRNGRTYAATRIYSPSQQSVAAQLACGSRFSSWHNGRLLRQVDHQRPLDSSSEWIAITLQAGWNAIVLTVDVEPPGDLLAFQITTVQSKLLLAEKAGRHDDQVPFVRDWLVLTPIPVPEAGWDTRLADLQPIHIESLGSPRAGDRIQVAGRELEWIEFRCEDYFTCFDALQLPDGPHLIYAVTHITEDADSDEFLFVTGGENSIQLAVNSQVQLTRETHNYNSSTVMTTSRQRVALRPGWNQVAVKILQLGSGSRSYVQLSDTTGNPVSGVRIQIAP